MLEAVKEAEKNAKEHPEHPFGAVIVKGDEVVGRGHDSCKGGKETHGETMALRDACGNLGTTDLSGCVLYSSAKPCPRCLGSLLYLHIDKVYYGASEEDIKERGIDYPTAPGESKGVEVRQMDRDEVLKIYDEYVSGGLKDEGR